VWSAAFAIGPLRR